MELNHKNKLNKSNKPSGHEQVLGFLEKLEHPLKQEIEEVRKIILSSNDQITEHIKWNAPSFCVNNQDRITFNFHGKEGFRLVFHCGSKKTDYADKDRLLQDDSGLLEWATGDRATLTFTSAKDVEDKRGKLIEVVTKWIEVTKDV
ncbi:MULTISPECIES: DUF1801 domain-containing protein [Paenibacillus]|uniref:YdhG-like domain-containing protein n=1 Tax=Paenibacillus woosongensis TaxID=307580 RepID=A0ABQ4MLD1_9BACL|nr:DUF1801 domain-containing protein [Paenibacillus woosongensis]GIP56724.1 hypothetical protein J15TS10_05380 [Paenibacillus woosongensis]